MFIIVLLEIYDDIMTGCPAEAPPNRAKTTEASKAGFNHNDKEILCIMRPESTDFPPIGTWMPH